MPKLPSVSAARTIRALKKAGFVEDRQKGSHVVLINFQTGARTVVPLHSGRNIKKGLLHAIISDARLTVSEFIKLLK